jgi:hypothetical protein
MEIEISEVGYGKERPCTKVGYVKERPLRLDI